MNFKEFLETQCLNYKDLYILEEYGEREEIEKITNQHGKKTKARVLVYSLETQQTTIQAIYVSRNGYTVLRGHRKYNLKLFKRKEEK